MLCAVWAPAPVKVAELARRDVNCADRTLCEGVCELYALHIRQVTVLDQGRPAGTGLGYK